MIVAVGSRNPTKIRAAKEAFEKAFGDAVKIIATQVRTGVPPTPIGDAQMIKGAVIRVIELMKVTKADYYVGMEGGLVFYERLPFIKGWVAVSDGRRLGLASTVAVPLPEVAVEEFRKKNLEEFEDVMVRLSGIPDIGDREGAIGFLTSGLYTRKDAFRDAVISALAIFIKQELYHPTRLWSWTANSQILGNLKD